MKFFAFLAYLVVEIAAFAALISLLGFWWAVLIVIAATVLGVVMLRRSAAGVLRDLAAALDGRGSAGPALMDSALVAVGAFFLAIPGLVSTVLGLLLLLAPVRAALRPAAAYLGAKRIASFVERSGLVGAVAGQPGGFGSFGGATVVDGTVADPGSRAPGPRPRPGYRELPPT